jgi:hypothetical protein
MPVVRLAAAPTVITAAHRHGADRVLQSVTLVIRAGDR